MRKAMVAVSRANATGFVHRSGPQSDRKRLFRPPSRKTTLLTLRAVRRQGNEAESPSDYQAEALFLTAEPSDEYNVKNIKEIVHQMLIVDFQALKYGNPGEIHEVTKGVHCITKSKHYFT